MPSFMLSPLIHYRGGEGVGVPRVAMCVYFDIDIQLNVKFIPIGTMQLDVKG